jgi:hypothetical protein
MGLDRAVHDGDGAFDACAETARSGHHHTQGGAGAGARRLSHSASQSCVSG